MLESRIHRLSYTVGESRSKPRTPPSATWEISGFSFPTTRHWRHGESASFLGEAYRKSQWSETFIKAFITATKGYGGNVQNHDPFIVRASEMTKGVEDTYLAARNAQRCDHRCWSSYCLTRTLTRPGVSRISWIGLESCLSACKSSSFEEQPSISLGYVPQIQCQAPSPSRCACCSWWTSSRWGLRQGGVDYTW